MSDGDTTLLRLTIFHVLQGACGCSDFRQWLGGDRHAMGRNVACGGGWWMVNGGWSRGSGAPTRSQVVGAMSATKRESYLLLLATPRPPAATVPKHVPGRPITILVLPGAGASPLPKRKSTCTSCGPSC
jgi:hypothetical protein